MAENVEKGIRSEILHDESVESGEFDVVAGSLFFLPLFFFSSFFFCRTVNQCDSVCPVREVDPTRTILGAGS